MKANLRIAITSNLARIIREKAAAQKLTIERCVARMLPATIDDEEATALTLTALARIAIEDDRAGGGPQSAQLEGSRGVT